MEEQTLTNEKSDGVEKKTADSMEPKEKDLSEERKVKKESKKTKLDIIDEVKDVKLIIRDLQAKIDKIGLAVNDINNKIPNEIEQTKISEINAQYAAEYQVKVSELEQAKADAIAKLTATHKEAMDAKVAELERAKADAIAKLTATHKEAMDAKVSELKQAKADAIAKLTATHKEAMDTKVADLEKAKADAIAKLTATHKEAMDAKVAELEQGKADAIAKLTATHKEAMDAKVAELENADGIIKRWEHATEPYVEVQNALNACTTVRALIEKKQVSGEGLENLISLIMTLGKDTTFVSELHKFMTEEKKKSKKEMTPEEANLYYSLNQCFRKTCGINHDIFVMPGNQNVKEKFNKIPFDRAQVENMNDPKNKSLKFTTAVYVPCLMSVETGRLYSQAQVKAGNS